MLALVACYLMASLGGTPARAQSLSEHQVKATFIYSFAKFIDWPVAASQAAFVIGILGDDPFRGRCKRP
jgi:hypothetical protein